MHVGAEMRAGRLRIISGKWRRRRLQIPLVPGIRPTPDRVRETLFNWLGARVEGAVCLDLFAGSGSLGFEAASRGAAKVTMVEIDAAVVLHLRDQARRLGAAGVDVVQADALRWVRSTPDQFDIVFLDPPFTSVLLERSCRSLAASGCLAPEALLYVECESSPGPPPLPEGFETVRVRRAGRVRYHLAARRLRRAWEPEPFVA